MLHQDDRAASQDVTEVIDSGQAQDCQAVLRDDVRGRNLSMLRFPLEFRPPHGGQEGRNRPPLQRLPSTERTHFRRHLPHPSHPRFRSWPRRISDLLKNWPSERLPPGPSQHEGCSEDGYRHALRLVWIPPDAVRLEKLRSNLSVTNGLRHEQAKRHIRVHRWHLNHLGISRTARARFAGPFQHSMMLRIGAQHQQVCFRRTRAGIPLPPRLTTRHQPAAWEDRGGTTPRAPSHCKSPATLPLPS